MSAFLATHTRTHSCGALRAGDAGKHVVLTGWVADRTAITAAACSSICATATASPSSCSIRSSTQAAHEIARRRCARSGASASPARCDRAAATSTTSWRPARSRSGSTSIEVFSRAETPPFAIEDDIDTNEALRLKYRYLDLRRPDAAEEPHACARRSRRTTRDYLGEQRLPRDRDAVHGEVHAGRRAQLPRAVAAQPGQVLRARRVAADLQAAADGRRLRALLPDRALLPRRGPAPRSPARVHADRHRDVVRQRADPADDDGGPDRGAVEGRARRRARRCRCAG